MIVWVADDGGQTEIVGDARALTYASEHDAVEKIVRVLRDEPQQLALRTYLADRAQLFSTDNFVRQIRTVVSVFE
jgi:hypothetical protein